MRTRPAEVLGETGALAAVTHRENDADATAAVADAAFDACGMLEWSFTLTHGFYHGCKSVGKSANQ